MSATSERGAFSISEKNDRQRVGRWWQIPRLGVALSLTLSTVTSAQSYRVLKSFNGSDGQNPWSDMVLAGSTLYGTTVAGGMSGCGLVFRMNADGSGFAVLKSFTGGSDGAGPYGGLVLSGSTLYGTTSRGGSMNAGVVFKVNTDGSAFAALKNFAGGSDGANPHGRLVLSGGTLYGTTQWGGISDGGVVFRANTDGSGFTVLKSFISSDGWHPWAGLV